MESVNETPTSYTPTPSFPQTTSKPGKSLLDIDFGTYIIILFSASFIILTWAFLIMCYFARTARHRVMYRDNTSGRTTSMSSTDSNVTIKSDLPPKYDAAINPNTFPRAIVLDPNLLEEAPPTYQDVIIVK